MLVNLLVEFLFRLTFGVAVAMGLTSSRDVTSGFFRVHLWMLMGMQTLAALAAYSTIPQGKTHAAAISYDQFVLAVAAALLSYFGAVTWMYERPRLGKAAIFAVAACALAGCWLPLAGTNGLAIELQLADRITGGLVLGAVTTAMLLGHWYLNTPTMKLKPLKRLVLLIAVAVGLRGLVCLTGDWLTASTSLSSLNMSPQTWGLFLALRWLSGLIGVLFLAFLTWQTLKIPNTQSATGILYAAVILAFIGELTSQLLSAEALYPV